MINQPISWYILKNNMVKASLKTRYEFEKEKFGRYQKSKSEKMGAAIVEVISSIQQTTQMRNDPEFVGILTPEAQTAYWINELINKLKRKKYAVVTATYQQSNDQMSFGQYF